MRCKACDSLLSDVDLGRKDRDTGDFLDLCGTCYRHSEEAKFLALEATVEDEDTTE